MKKIFPVIIVLIALSVLGIIVFQISWLQNMLLLREDQIKQKVADVTTLVCDELAQYKAVPDNSGFKPFGDENFKLDFSKPFTISQRFTVAELHEKIRQAFLAQDLKNIPFEFGISTNAQGVLQFQRESSVRFSEWYEDTVNHYQYNRPIVPPSGSAVENLVADEFLTIVVPNVQNIVLKSLRPWFAVAILFTLIIFTAFFLTVRTLLRQKKLSEIKNDFINNMTHEFKTPIATISLAVDALRNEKVQADPKKLTYFSEIIKEENVRMNRQVETILKSALMDRQELQLASKPLHVHQIIQDVADNFALRLQEKGGGLELKLNAANDLINADEVHISNLINNLMDNAVKYSKEDVPPQIVVSTSSTARKLQIRLDDNGIGMTRETVKRIFEKFYRAHTGNLHNVKGFGLGLSYVEDVIEAHGGTIRVDSTLGRGSSFIIEFPLVKNPA